MVSFNFIASVVLGVSLGIFATLLDLATFRQQAAYALRWYRFRAVLNHWPGYSISRIASLEWCIVLIGFWIALFILWPSGQDPAVARLAREDMVIGALVGLVAAPWLVLHFTRVGGGFGFTPGGSGQANSEALATPGENASGDPDQAPVIGWYRTLAAVVGIALFAFFGVPFLAQQIPGGKVEGFGISVSLPERAQGAFVLPLAPASGQTDALADPWSQYARNASTMTSTDDLEKQTREPFRKWSMVTRDLAYMSFLRHEAATSVVTNRSASASPYMRYFAETGLLDVFSNTFSQDRQFVEAFRPLFACLSSYGREKNDIRLNRVQLEPLLVFLLTRTRSAGDPNQSRLRAVYDGLNEFKLCVTTPVVFPTSLPLPNNVTPYPTLLAAFALGINDQPEAALQTISEWLTGHSPRDRFSPGWLTSADPWMVWRARAMLIHMASEMFPGKIPQDNLIMGQRALTDELGLLLKVRDAAGFKALCSKLPRNSIHGQIGRELAFQYATERSYLFELQTPSWIRRRLQSKEMPTSRLEEDLKEAEQFQKSADCFDGVEIFKGLEGTRADRFIGQFYLDAAQLRMGRLPTLSSRESVAERGIVHALLEVAEAKLGKEDTQLTTSEGAKQPGPVERLFARDDFAVERERLRSLSDSLQR